MNHVKNESRRREVYGLLKSVINDPSLTKYQTIIGASARGRVVPPPSSVIFEALYEGKIIGGIYFGQEWETLYSSFDYKIAQRLSQELSCIHAIAVEETFRDQDVGSLLIDKMEKLLISEGLHCIYGVANKSLEKFYTGRGFTFGSSPGEKIFLISKILDP
ncbi:GNAT family N-acetyltransferase [Rothia nasimurium]|uniref:GNAT family N-acetyltransferase n=1 Tax=Rothia nasimurium TaxID=85336 RepID=UPI0009F23B9B